MYFIALIAAETSKFFFTLKYHLDTSIRIKTVEPFESPIKFECCNYYLKSNRSVLVLFSFVLTIEDHTMKVPLQPLRSRLHVTSPSSCSSSHPQSLTLCQW